MRFFIVVIIIACFLRLLNLNQSLWLDEASQLKMSSSIYSIWFERAGDFHPPLSYILTHFWLQIGTGEVWLRLLPVLFGVGTVILVYLLSVRLFNRQIALLSAFFLAIAPFHIYYSQELRMYSQSAFFATLSMYFFIIFLKNYSIKNIFFLSAASSALLYTHYMGGFLLLIQALYLLIIQRDKLLQFAKSQILVLIIFFPWIPQLIKQLQFGVSADQFLPGWSSVLSLSFFKALPLTFIKFSIGRISFDNNFLYIAVALVVFMSFGFLMLKAIKEIKKEEFLVLFWLIIPIILTLVVSFKIPIFQPFRLLFILPAFYILLALGISKLEKFRKMFMFVVILISLASLSVYYFDSSFHREDWRSAAQFIDSRLDNQSIVMFAWNTPFDPYKWYSNNKGVGLLREYPATMEQLESNTKILANKKDVFLFNYLQDLSDPNRITQQWLIKQGYQLGQTYDFRGVGFVENYTKD